MERDERARLRDSIKWAMITTPKCPDSTSPYGCPSCLADAVVDVVEEAIDIERLAQ